MEISKDKNYESYSIEKLLSIREVDKIGFLLEVLQILLEKRNQYKDPRYIILDLNSIEVDGDYKPNLSIGEIPYTQFDDNLYRLVETSLLMSGFNVKNIEKQLRDSIDKQRYGSLISMVSTLRFNNGSYDKEYQATNESYENISKNKIDKINVRRGGLSSVKLEKSHLILILTALIYFMIVFFRLLGRKTWAYLPILIILASINIFYIYRNKKNIVKNVKKNRYYLISKDYKLKYPLEIGNNFIGRSGDFSNIVIEDKTIGRRHANIVISPSGVIIKDLNSKNGSSVNGKSLGNTELSIFENDLILFSKREFILIKDC